MVKNGVQVRGAKSGWLDKDTGVGTIRGLRGRVRICGGDDVL